MMVCDDCCMTMTTLMILMVEHDGARRLLHDDDGDDADDADDADDDDDENGHDDDDDDGCDDDVDDGDDDEDDDCRSSRPLDGASWLSSSLTMLLG